jgi:hypothetical protein
MPSWLAGALTGLGTGVAAGFVLGIATITAKRIRNGRLMAKGEAPIKDVVFMPFYAFYGPVGAIAGGIAAAVRDEGVVTGILAGLAVPVLMTLVILVAIATQMRA